MLWTAITIHLLLSASLIWLAWQMWQLRQAFVATVKAVDSWTIACQSGLANAPEAIMVAKVGASQARGKYGTIRAQFSKIYGILQTVQRIYLRLQPKPRATGRRKNGKR